MLPAKVFHIVEAQNLGGIGRDGLWPARDLLHRAHGPQAGEAVSRTHRASALVLADGVKLRDQSPMPPQALAAALDPPLTPADWYAEVNRGVYFWADEARLERHLHALRGSPQAVIAFDTARLLSDFEAQAFLTPINVGAAYRRPARRGHRTFVPVSTWRDSRWRDEAAPGNLPRSRAHPPSELVVRAIIPEPRRYACDWPSLPQAGSYDV